MPCIPCRYKECRRFFPCYGLSRLLFQDPKYMYSRFEFFWPESIRGTTWVHGIQVSIKKYWEYETPVEWIWVIKNSPANVTYVPLVRQWVSLCVSLRVCRLRMYPCVCMCMCLYVRLRVCLRLGLPICIGVSTYVCVYVCPCVCMCMCLCVNVYVCPWCVCVCVYMCVYVYVYLCVCINALQIKIPKNKWFIRHGLWVTWAFNYDILLFKIRRVIVKR